MKKATINSIKSQKNREKLTMITAYDALFAAIFDGAVDMILVGDSLEMSFGGKKDTLEASMESMIYHINAVCRGAKNTFIIADMPFGGALDKKLALKNSVRFYKESGADAVKVEINENNYELVSYLTKNQIAVVAHIGLTPQSSRFEGGYIIKGKSENGAKNLVELARICEENGAFLIVLEGTLKSVAREVTKAVNIPVIGIGAGNECDGQVLVWSDAFGFYDEFKPKFVRRFMNGKEMVKNALNEYVKSVKNGSFPSDDESYA